MIDWLTLYIPYPVNDPVCSGVILSTDNDGNLEYKTLKRLSVNGSYESAVTVRSVYRDEFEHISTTTFNALEISGNPSKLLQGHNIFGSDDIWNLALHMISVIYSKLGHKDHLYKSFCATSLILVTRVDINYSYHLSNSNQVKQWLYSAESSCRMKHRGRGLLNEGTLYFGKGSKRSTLKFYHKGQEIKDNKKYQYVTHPILTEYADKSLRCELKISSLEIASLGLRKLWDWKEISIYNLFMAYVSKLEFNMNLKQRTVKNLSNLSPKELSIYSLWKDGHDIRSVYSKSYFYKLRKSILDKISVDVSIPPSDELPSNVLPLISFLDAKPASIPKEAYMEGLVFSPEVPLIRTA